MSAFSVERREIGGRRVWTVEEHHQVLLPWAAERAAAGHTLCSLTLDHHTDTLPAFTHYMETHGGREVFFEADYHSEPELRAVLEHMRHDEHIDYACRAGILERALLFTHVNYSISTNPQIRIMHEKPSDDPAQLKAYFGQALESAFLRNLFDLAGMPELPRDFILDIDLDYFKTPESFQPKDATVFHELIRRARAVTISRERDWVRLLNLDYDRSVTADRIEAGIMEHIRTAMQSVD